MSLPIPRSTLEEMERNRARALECYAAAFDMTEKAREFASLAAISGKTSETSGAVPGQFSDQARDALAPRYAGAHVDERRTRFLGEMTLNLDRSMWAHIIRATDLERLMDKQAREEFRASLDKDPPAATPENVRATLGAMLESADTIFKRGIANAFSSLDRRFKSHDGFKVGSRVILPYMFNANSGGWNYHARQDETLRDIERTFCVLDGKPQPERAAGIVGTIEAQGWFAQQFTVECDYFKVRRFKNGNAHLWFKRDDLVRRVNRLLADYYGEVIGEGSDVADVSDMGPGYHLTPARNFGYFPTSRETAEKVFELAGNVEGLRVLEPSAGCGSLADMARDLGARVTCVEVQEHLAGQLADKGHDVRLGDFLTMKPASLGELFDVIVMNPPFDLGRDCDHVRHALQFLKPGGRLVAIMSAGTRYREDKRATSFRALVEKVQARPRWGGRLDDPFRDLPAGSFAHAGTMVNAVTLAIRTREEEKTQ